MQAVNSFYAQLLLKYDWKKSSLVVVEVASVVGKPVNVRSLIKAPQTDPASTILIL